MDEGASNRELLMEACRRNNVSLLESLLSALSDPETTSQFLNTSTDALGSSALHVAASYGSYEVLDLLLDQSGVEIDHAEPREGDTALHKAVRYANGQEQAVGEKVVEILLDAGCDPRVRNKAKLKPVELVDPRNKDLKTVLQKAEFAMLAGDDVVPDDEDEAGPPTAGDD